MDVSPIACTCPMSVRESGQHSITCRALWDCKAPTVLDCPRHLSVLNRAMAVRGYGSTCIECEWKVTP